MSDFSGVNSALSAMVAAEVDRIVAQAVEEATAGLRAALVRYGRHEDGCESRFEYWTAPYKRPCTCGLSAVLEGN